jgi:hypothetical protein
LNWAALSIHRFLTLDFGAAHIQPKIVLGCLLPKTPKPN